MGDEVSSWKISVTNALRAHFVQPDGPSKPGADWIVSLKKSGETKQVIVRIFADDVSGMAPAQEAQAAASYVAELLKSGWLPANYQGKPGELTVPSDQIRSLAQTRHKPWWRFW
ncbi:MAG: hypothetical protein K8S99_13925 [Planctomycetes bacterium]|nr:hypothetical protein [Planctomycetota bacterium]